MTDNSKPWNALPKGFKTEKVDLAKIQQSINEISQKLDDQKKEFQNNKNEEYEFQGNVAKENVWAAFSLAIGSAFLSVGVAVSMGIFEMINNANNTQQINWNFISAYQNFGALMMLGGLFLIAVGAIASFRRIVKFVNQITKKQELENDGNSKIQKNNLHVDWKTHLALGMIIIIFGSILFLIPILNDRPEVDRWEGFDVTRQHNVTLSSLQFNIVTIDENQSLHIFYATDEISGDNPFLMFTIPYLVTMINPDGNKFSIPEEWKIQQIPDLKTTLVYKFFDCSGKEYCSDQYNMYFDFQEKIDSKQYYTHSVNIPFLSPSHEGVHYARDNILNGIPIYQIKENWEMSHNSKPVLRVSVLDDSTEYNVIPDGYLQSHKYNRTGVTNSVMVWDIPDHRIDFHLDYVNPQEKYDYDTWRTISLVLFGTGTAFLVVSYSEYRKHV